MIQLPKAPEYGPNRKAYSVLCVAVAAQECSSVFWGDIFKQWANLKGWATGVWLTGQTTAVQCAVMSCRGLTCWASSSCLTQMTNHRVLAEMASEYIVFFHQFFLLRQVKNPPSHHQPRTSFSHILPLLPRVPSCPVSCHLWYYKNTDLPKIIYM